MKDSNSISKTEPTAEVAVVATPMASPTGKMLKRSEAARMLGVSVSTLRRREGELVKSFVGPDGVHMFEESEIRSVSVTHRRRLENNAGVSNGGVAADVFELLDEGIHPVEIVKRLRLPPDAVTSLREQWARMRGGFVVEEDDKMILGSFAHAFTAKSGRELVALVRKRLDHLEQRADLASAGFPRCRYCNETSACVCIRCLIERRGRMIAYQPRLEKRTTESGVDEVRVVAEMVWDDEPFEEGGRSLLQMYSDWKKPDAIAMTGFVHALAERVPADAG